MKALTIAVALLGGLAFATAASAGGPGGCPFSSSQKDKTVEKPILQPSTSS